MDDITKMSSEELDELAEALQDVKNVRLLREDQKRREKLKEEFKDMPLEGLEEKLYAIEEEKKRRFPPRKASLFGDPCVELD